MITIEGKGFRENLDVDYIHRYFSLMRENWYMYEGVSVYQYANSFNCTKINWNIYLYMGTFVYIYIHIYNS